MEKTYKVFPSGMDDTYSIVRRGINGKESFWTMDDVGEPTDKLSLEDALTLMHKLNKEKVLDGSELTLRLRLLNLAQGKFGRDEIFEFYAILDEIKRIEFVPLEYVVDNLISLAETLNFEGYSEPGLRGRLKDELKLSDDQLNKLGV